MLPVIIFLTFADLVPCCGLLYVSRNLLTCRRLI